jgi:hypothetical protein
LLNASSPLDYRQNDNGEGEERNDVFRAFHEATYVRGIHGNRASSHAGSDFAESTPRMAKRVGAINAYFAGGLIFIWLGQKHLRRSNWADPEVFAYAIYWLALATLFWFLALFIAGGHSSRF